MTKNYRHVRNHLLANMPRADFDLLQPNLKLVELPLRHSLEKPDQLVRFAYFPENCLVSVVADSGVTGRAEVGIISYEGVTAHGPILRDDRAAHHSFIQAAGAALRIEVASLRRAIDQSRSLHNSLLAFVNAFAVQTAHTALASGRGTLEQRLARWLVMAQDRLGGAELKVTHEFLSVMLAVRRSGVTMTIQRLRRKGHINTERGKIVILSRIGLEELAGNLYGIPEKHYDRLLGWKP